MKNPINAAWARIPPHARKWIVTLSIPLTLGLALVSWPSYLSAVSVFCSGANFTFALMEWWPVLIPYRVIPPTKEQLVELDRQMREKLKPMIDAIAAEAGLGFHDGPPTSKIH